MTTYKVFLQSGGSVEINADTYQFYDYDEDSKQSEQWRFFIGKECVARVFFPLAIVG